MTDELVAPVGDPEPAQKAAPPAVTATDTAKDGTSYVLLERQDDGRWYEWMVVDANSADAAIRKHITAENGMATDKPSTFVAVPSRSFRPVTVKTKTVTSLVIEEAA